MLSISKKMLILMVFIGLIFTVVYAANPDSKLELNPVDVVNPYIEEVKLSSSRFTQMDDLRAVDPDHFLRLTSEDELVLENTQFALYMNRDDISFKVKNKATGYIWSTVIDDPQAGTYTGLLSSSIGFEYINIPQSYARRQNVGVNDTEFTADITVANQTVTIDFAIGGFCATRQCSRFYPLYVEGDPRYDLETMIGLGFTQVELDFRLEVSLTENGIRAHIPFDRIVEGNPSIIALSSFIVFPGLGATFMDEIPGYMVIPDGVGTIIRYTDKEGRFITPFEERFYGLNAGVVSARASVTSYPLSMPIYGAVHGVHQDAFIAMIESGDLNARLLAFPNGAANLPYNLIFTKFDYRQTFRQSFTSDGSGGGQRIHQSGFDDITVRFDFLEGEKASYVGMARHYQAYLVELGHLQRLTETRENIPIHLQYLMADSKNQFIGRSLVPMTHVDDIKAMHQFFVEQGLTHQRVSLMGWNQGGYSGQLPSAVNFESRLGSDRDFRELIALIQEENRLFLLNNYVYASNATRRVSYRNDVAQGVNRFKLEWECSNCVYTERYILYPEAVERLALRDLADYTDLGVEVLFESLASMLYSYHKRTTFTRTDTHQYFDRVMAEYEGIGSFLYPNAYAYQYTQDFFAAPLYNSQLNYFDDLVPFLPIVLSGHMELFSNFLNFNSLGRIQTLMLVDFNINPSFILTKERSSNLSGTDIERFYATQFAMWQETVVEDYHFINDALKHVINETIEDRVVLELGVVKVTYSNNVEIFINYTNTLYSADGIVIPPLDYFVREGEK